MSNDMQVPLVLPEIPGALAASTCFWAFANCFSGAFFLLWASLSDAEGVDLECLALDLVEGPLAAGLALLGSEVSAICCLGEDPAELLLLDSIQSAIIAGIAVINLPQEAHSK